MQDDLIKQLPGYFSIKNREGQFIAFNDKLPPLLGCKNFDDLFGLTDYELPCPASDFADVFEKEDKQVLDTEKELQTININRYSDGIHVLRGHKKIIRAGNDNIALLAGQY